MVALKVCMVLGKNWAAYRQRVTMLGLSYVIVLIAKWRYKGLCDAKRY